MIPAALLQHPYGVVVVVVETGVVSLASETSFPTPTTRPLVAARTSTMPSVPTDIQA